MRSVLFKTVLSFFLLFFSFYGQTAYDVMKRYSLSMGKMGNQEILDPVGRSVFMDIGGMINENIFGLIRDVASIKPTDVSGFFSNNAEIEQAGAFSLKMGTPLPRFKFLGTRFYPQLNLMTELGAVLGFPGSAGTTFHFYNHLKAGLGTTLNFRYRKRINGFLKLYTDTKSDFKMIKSQSDLMSDGGVETNFGSNLHSDLSVSLRLGYKRKKWSAFYQLEDLNIISIIKIKDSQTYHFGENSLSRIHGDYRLKHRGFALKAFAGAHQRKGHYNWGESLYFGGDLSAKVWKGRFGVTTRLMMDPEHWNIGLKLKGWIGHLNYLIRLPKASSVDGVKVSSLHSLNLRTFF